MTEGRRVAIVAGVGPGIGRSTALALAGQGYDVAVAARRIEYLDSVVAELEALGRRGLAVPTDMGDLEQSRALAEHVAAHFGRIDVVVGSAAKGGPNHTIMNADLGDWQEAWQVNVLGPLELARAAIPHLRAVGGGAIVMVSTLAVRAINIGQGAYAATKSALTVAAQTLAKEVGRDGIRVNIVVPGFVPGAEHRHDVRATGRTSRHHPAGGHGRVGGRDRAKPASDAGRHRRCDRVPGLRSCPLYYRSDA